MDKAGKRREDPFPFFGLEIPGLEPEGRETQMT
jgi:hypothetical protein